MRISEAHIAFWRAKKSPAPKWFRQAKGYVAELSVVAIDRLVNAHAGIRLTEGEMQAHTTLVILRSARKRGNLQQLLARMAQTPQTVVNPKRRAGYCRKWLARIEKGTAVC